MSINNLIYKNAKILNLTDMYPDRLFRWVDNHNRHFTFININEKHDYKSFIRIDINYFKEISNNDKIKYVFVFVFIDGSFCWPLNDKQLMSEWNFNIEERYIKFKMFHRDHLIHIDNFVLNNKIHHVESFAVYDFDIEDVIYCKVKFRSNLSLDDQKTSIINYLSSNSKVDIMIDYVDYIHDTVLDLLDVIRLEIHDGSFTSSNIEHLDNIVHFHNFKLTF